MRRIVLGLSAALALSAASFAQDEGGSTVTRPIPEDLGAPPVFTLPDGTVTAPGEGAVIAIPDETAGGSQAAATGTGEDFESPIPQEALDAVLPDVEAVAVTVLARAALGEIPADRVDAQFDEWAGYIAKADEKMTPAIPMNAISAAGKYLDYVESQGRASTDWPPDRPQETYIGMAAVKLVWLRDDLAAGKDLLAIVREANRILGWAKGVNGDLPPELDHFARYDALIERAGTALTAMEAPKRPETPQ